MKDDDMFSFENDDFNMPSFDDSGGGKKKSFFKDLAKGVVVGSYNKLEKYIPALQDTRESAADMSDQIRDQANMVKQQANRAGSYFKGVTDDVKKISDEIKNTKGLRAKISAAEKGFDQAKKNLAYAIDSEAAASFDMDAMFDDGDYSSSNSATVSPGKSTSQPDSTTETKLRNEKLGIDSDFGLSPSSKSKRTSSSGRKFFSQTIVNGDSSDKIMADRLSAEALRETVMASSAAIISSQSKIFKQTNIINTKMHLEKMNALNRIAEATYMSSKLYAEQIAPTQLQINDRLAKNEAQLSDVIALLRDANGGDSPIAKALGGNKRGGKRNIMDFVTSSGGIDLGGLYRHTSTQLKEQADGMGLGMISSLKDMLPMMLMGGDKSSAGKSLGKLIGGLALSPFKGKITAIGDTLSQALPNTLLNTYDKMKHSDNSMLSGLAELMNIDTGTKGTVDLDTRNRRVSFDMVTRRSIVEVIPGYLSKILSAVNGKEEMSFDHKTGQFTTKTIMQNRIQKQIDNAGMGSFDSTKRNLSKRDSTLKDSDMNKILKNIMMSGRPFNVENLGDNNYYRKVSEGVSKEAFAQFLDAYDSMDPKEKAQLSISATRARKSRTDTLNSLSVDLSEYGEGSFLGSSQIDAKIKDLERQKFDVEKIKGNGSVDMRGKAIMMDKLRKNAGIDMEIADLKTIQAASGDVKGDVSSAISNSPINKIYDLLLDGILVYPQNVDGLPAHIRKARKSRKNEAFEKDAAKRNLDRANSEYERILRELSGQQGEEIENALENRKLNVAQQLLKTFGGDVGIKKIFGDANGDKILSKIQKVSNASPWNEYSNAGNKILGKVEKFVNDVQTPDGSIDFSKIASKSGTAVAEVKATFENLRDQYKDPEVAKKKLFDIYNASKAKVSEAYATGKDKAGEAFSKAKESYGTAKSKAKEVYSSGKEKASDIYNASKAKVSEAYATGKDKAGEAFSKADEIINGKIGDLKNKIKTPEQLKTKLAEESMDDETKKKVKDASDSSIVGMLGAFVTGTMAKFNTALFGKDESKIPHKTGFLGTAFDKVRSLPGMVMKFLVGDKKMGKVGLLQTMGAPFLKMMENARHSLMSKFIIPFKSIGEQMKESIKWKARDRAIWLKNLGIKLRGSKESRNAKKAERRKRRNEKLLAKGKIPGNSVWDKVFGLGTNLSNVAVSPFALATRFSLNRSDKQMQKLLASGKISQEDYDEWISKQEEAQDAELARHNRNEEDIKSLQNKVDTSRINDAKLRAELEGMNGTTAAQKAKIDKMSYADIKADQKRAKAAMKANKEKLARGEKLTREEEYAALTQQQLLYRMQDDNKKKLENEVKRQEEAAEREKMEMQREQTNATKDSKDFLAGILWYMSGGKSGKKPMGSAAQAKKDAKEASGRYDSESGLLNGSYADQKADAMENEEAKLLKEISGKIPKDNPKIKAEEKEDKKSLLDSLGGIAGLIAGLGSMVAGGLGVASFAKSFLNVGKRFKQDGFVGGIGELTGLDRYGDSAFDANGNKKGFLQASADRFRGGRFLLRGGLKKSAKLFTKGAAKTGKTLIAPVKAVGKLATKIPGVGKAAGAVAKGAKTVGTKITGMLQKFFNIPAIAKKVPKGKVAGIIGKISAKVGQTAVGKAAGSVLKFLSGPAGLAAMAAADFATGAAQAKRYFKIGPGQKATAGMRTAAGLSNALNNSLLMGILPMDWLTETIYRLVADDKAEAALDAQQQAYRERAEMLGVDPERLNELENKTLGKKFLNLFKGKDKKLAEEAKLMGMSVEEYAEWKKTYDESLKAQDSKTEKAKEVAESKIASQTSINSNGGLLIPNANGGKFNANGETTNSSGEVVNKEAIEAAAELAQNPEALEGMDNESKKKLSELLKIGVKNGIKAASVGQLALRQNIKKGMNRVKEGIKNTPARIAESMKNFYGLSKNAAKAIATGLTNVGKGIANAGKTVFNKVSGGLSAAGTMFVTGAKNVGNKISETVKAFKADPKGFVADLGDKIKDSFDSIKDKVSEGLLKAWEGFKDVITAFGEKLKSGFINVVDGVKDGWAKLTGGVKNAAGKVKDGWDAFWNPDMTDAENIAMAEKMGLDANSIALEQQIKNPDYKLASGNYDTTSIQSDLGKNGEKIESSMRSVEDVAASNDMYLNKLDEIATMANNAKAMEQSHNDMMTQTGTMNKELQVVESQTVIFQQMLAVLRSMQMSGQSPVVNYNGKPVELRYQEGQNVPIAVPVNYNGDVSQLPSYDPTIYADVGT